MTLSRRQARRQALFLVYQWDVSAAEIAWDAGEPFERWWVRHPEYHRAAWLGADA